MIGAWDRDDHHQQTIIVIIIISLLEILMILQPPKKKNLNSDKCRPIEEFIMWRNVDRKVALPPS